MLYKMFHNIWKMYLITVMQFTATSHNEAIEIVKSKTGYNWEWEASLADNDEVWQ